MPFETPIFAELDTTVRQVLCEMKAGQQGSVLVRDHDQLAGIFTERDALRAMASNLDLDAPIRACMTTNPVTVLVSDTVGKAIQLMSAGGYRRLPILDDGGVPVGIIKVSHILHYMVEHFPQFVYNLPPTPHHTTQEREGA